MADNKSTTWSAHLRLLCIQYSLPDPLSLMLNPPPSKDVWKSIVTTKITAFHEARLRNKAEENSKMNFLNVSLLGLSGKCHPIISSITDSRDIPKLRMQLKFLTGDVLTKDRLVKQNQGADPYCDLCHAHPETSEHIITHC